MSSKGQKNTSFTFVEILVIISILGAVAMGSSIGLAKQLSKARDAERKLLLKPLYNALENYYDSTLCYPAFLPSCGQKLLLRNITLLDSVPCDPLTHLPYTYITDNVVCNTQFKLYAKLENKEDRDIAYLGCTYGCGPDCLYNYGFASSNTWLETCPGPITPTKVPTPTPSSPTPTVTLPITSTTPTITLTPTPSLQPAQYVCAPGLGNDGHCTLFVYPELSECPIIWLDDPTCDNSCNIKANHCKTSKGKKN
ncbi:type II secretion system protein [Candidatus Roizmanbacteria bacterium]|nr:type II secretion system protein [Candidatus Roizmanbacteria bacterium]